MRRVVVGYVSPAELGRDGMIGMHAELNTLVMKVARRAENAPAEVLKAAFVPVRSLMAHLELPEHQVLFGRRGTGKTHLMRFLQEERSAEGALAIYLDLRQIGAAEDVFSTRQDNFPHKTTGLLIDVVEHVHTQVYEQVLSDRWSPHLSEISDALDALAAAATQIQVVGVAAAGLHSVKPCSSESRREADQHRNARSAR